MFFFNPSTKTSVWTRPAELEGREDVDKLVKEPPKQEPKKEETKEVNENKREAEVTEPVKIVKKPK